MAAIPRRTTAALIPWEVSCAKIAVVTLLRTLSPLDEQVAVARAVQTARTDDAVPQADDAVLAAAGERLAVGREGQACDHLAAGKTKRNAFNWLPSGQLLLARLEEFQ